MTGKKTVIYISVLQSACLGNDFWLILQVVNMVTMTKLLFFMLELWSVTVVWGAVDPYRTHCCLCNNLMPSDAPPNSKPQIMPSPFKIKVSSDTYTLDQELTGK